MCLGVPGQVTDIWNAEDTGLPMARVNFGGIGKEVCLAFEPQTRVGEYVLVHVGFAISRIDEAEAARTLALLREMGELSAELGEETHREVPG